MRWRGDRRAVCLWIVSVIMSTAAFATDSIASRLSPEWKSLDAEVRALDGALARLPDIPIEDYGGRRAFLQVFEPAGVDQDLSIDFAIRLRWPEPRPVDLVALVPAREIDSLGLDPNYGFPEDFGVSLIDPGGDITPVATFRSMSDKVAHRGHPIVIRAPVDSIASGLEIRVARAREPRPGAPRLVFIALAEIFCYSGEHNLAADATVEVHGQVPDALPSFWSPEMLIDGVTPLGLPERPDPGDGEKHIGWLSKGRSSAEPGISITLDLGETRRLDGIRLFPALRPSIGDFPGFGIPELFRLRVSNRPDEANARIVFDHTAESTSEAGHNPHEFHFSPTEARYVGLEAVRLWKPYQHYPAFLALSEMQILDGDEVISQGARPMVTEETTPVRAHADHLWSPRSLSDGRGPSGMLVPRREWLEDLDKRLTLETRRHEAVERMAHLERLWDRGTLATAATLGLAGFGFAAFLPVRYRRRERRRIRTIRQRIAGDLHDDVGSNLGSIQMLSRMAQSKGDPSRELETIHQVAAETVNSVRDIVWLLHPRETDRVPTIDHLRESAAILLDSLDWTLQSDFQDWKLGDEDGRHLVLFFREALYNIRRHSAASRVRIHVGQDDDRLVLDITDDGRGIPPDQIDRPGALRALHQRADRLGGDVTVESRQGHGTTIRLGFVPRSPGSCRNPIPHPELP